MSGQFCSPLCTRYRILENMTVHFVIRQASFLWSQKIYLLPRYSNLEGFWWIDLRSILTAKSKNCASNGHTYLKRVIDATIHENFSLSYRVEWKICPWLLQTNSTLSIWRGNTREEFAAKLALNFKVKNFSLFLHCTLHEGKTFPRKLTVLLKNDKKSFLIV